MEISIIASGSNGNCCLIEHNDTSVLIDAGLSGKEIETRMNSLGKSLENVDAVIITHAHRDHVCGAGIISRKYHLPVYLKEESYKKAALYLGRINVKIFNRLFKVKKLTIKPVRTSHSIASSGFVINNFGLFTDTGIVTKEMEKVLPKLKAVLLESNHDIDMLVNGSYPWPLKQLILSDVGHLSNIHASTFLQDKGKNLEIAFLGHLSGNNNSIEVAKNTFKTLVKRKINFEVCCRDQISGSWTI